MTLLYELTQGSLAAEITPHLITADDVAIETILNRIDIPVYGLVAISDFMKWTGSSGLRAVIDDVSIDKTSPLRSIALILKDAIGTKTPIDLSSPINQVMMAAWVTVGAITEYQQQELFNLSTRLISKAEEAGIDVTALDIRREIWNDDGSRKL